MSLIVFTALNYFVIDLKGEEPKLKEYIKSFVSSSEDGINENSVFDTINQFYLKLKQVIEAEPEATSKNNLKVYQIKSKDKLLVINQDNKAKVVHKDSEGEFNLDQIIFEGYPRTIKDSVLLSLKTQEFLLLFKYMDWSLVSAKSSELMSKYTKFFKAATETLRKIGVKNDLLVFSVEVSTSKAVLDDLLYCLSKLRNKRSRELSKLSVISAGSQSLKSNKVDCNYEYLEGLEIYTDMDKNISIHDINTVLNIVYKLDEQQWLKSVYGTSNEELVNLFTSVSRPCSALDRLSTFVGQEQSLHYLAEYGYIFRGDGVLYNVYSDTEIKEIHAHWNDKIQDTLILKNNVNASIADSLNYMHAPTLLPSNDNSSESNLLNIVTSDISDFVYVTNEKGICKIYSVDLGLVHIGTIDLHSDSSDTHEKWINQLISFELNNVKTQYTDSGTSSLNIKKEKLKPSKNTKNLSKPKPKKGMKFQTSKTKNVNYDDEEDVMDVGGLFDDDYYDDYYDELPPEEPADQKQEPKEDKIDTTKEKKEAHNLLGYSICTNTDFKGYLAGIVSCIIQQSGKLILVSKTVHYNFTPSNLELCDFTKYATNKSDGKKNLAKTVLNKILASYRNNLVHLVPFFETKRGNDSYSPLWDVYKDKLSLSDNKIEKVLAQTKINDMPEDYDYIYILCENSDHKVALFKIKFVINDSSFKIEIAQSAEVKDWKLDCEYSIIHQLNKVAVVGDGKIIVINAAKLEEQHKIDWEDLSYSNVVKILKETDVEKVTEEVKEDAKDESNKEEKVEEGKTEEPQQQGKIRLFSFEIFISTICFWLKWLFIIVSLELLKEGDCDLTELNQIFTSKPILGNKILAIEDLSNGVASEQEFNPTKNLHRVELKLLYNSNEKLTEDNRTFDLSKVQYDSTVSQKDITEKLKLRVHSNTGSQINPTSSPSLLVDDGNTSSYISNYPRPTIIFKHYKDLKFVPKQITVSSKFNRERSNADSYPMGAGLVFCANSVKEFDSIFKNKLVYYNIQSRRNYDQWFDNRNKINMPLRENEPVAFFELGSNREITITLEQTRPCKFIMLMPTDFRKKPIKFTKRFHSNNCEIDSFRVSGTELSADDDSKYKFTAKIESDVVKTDTSAVIEFRSNNEWSVFKTIDKIDIKNIESLDNQYCISLLGLTQSWVTGSHSLVLDLSEIKDFKDAIRVTVKSDDSNSLWNFKTGHFVVYDYPNDLSFKSKGLRRVQGESVIDLYTDNAKLGNMLKQLIDLVHDSEQLEYIRYNILQHLNTLSSEDHISILRDNFKFISFLEDPNLASYSNQFKSMIFRTISKIGVDNLTDNSKTFPQYTLEILQKIQEKGLDNFDIVSLHFIYMINKQLDQNLFEINYKILTDFIFGKALPAWDESKKFNSISFESDIQDHINVGTLLTRSKTSYELITDLNTVHSINYIKLLFDENTSGCIFSLKISIYTIDENNDETLLLKTGYGDDVYQLVVSRVEADSSVQDKDINSITISLTNIENQSRYFKIRIDHIETYQSKNDSVQDPRNVIFPLFYGYDMGISSPTNSFVKTLKNDINQNANKLEDVLTMNNIDFNVFEKCCAYIVPRKFTKKELKNLPEDEGLKRLLESKQKEQVTMVKDKKYDAAREIAKEIKQIKNKSRDKQIKHNNMTVSEILVLSADIMNYICPDKSSEGKEFEGGITSLSEKEQYELLKNLVEYYLLPKDDVEKVISLQPVHRIIEVILNNISNANSIFFDMVQRLLVKRSESMNNQSNKKAKQAESGKNVNVSDIFW